MYKNQLSLIKCSSMTQVLYIFLESILIKAGQQQLFTLFYDKLTREAKKGCGKFKASIPTLKGSYRMLIYYAAIK